VLHALSPDDPCRVVTLAKSAQLGGTVVANVFCGGSLAMDPGDFLYVHPTEENGRRWSKMKFSPMLKSTAVLAKAFAAKSRDGADSVMYKERVDGRGAIQISGANSPASLSQVSMRRQVQDDLAKWEMNSAGDPETQADSRSEGYDFAKILKVSTPLVMPGCRITRNFDAGSQELPYVPCPHCEHMQVLEWENMLAALDEAKPEKACFTCIDCGGVIEEHHRRGMNAKLEWRAQNPAMKRYHRSFWIWSAYSVLQNWERIARRWLAAKGDPASEQTFLNDTVGKAYRTAGESPPWETLRDRAAESPYKIGTIPHGFLAVFMGLDCQKDRVEWQVVAFGRDFCRAVIDCGVVPGHISEPRTQALLDALLEQTWPNSFGQKLGIDLAGIDGNAWTEDVWSFVKRHPTSRVVMLRGANTDQAPLLARVAKERNRAGKLLSYSRRFYTFGTSVLKMALYRNVAKTDPLEAGYVAFPKGLSDDYFRQLTAERRVPKRGKTGFVSYVWAKDPAQANEMLDTHLQAEAAAIKWGVRGLPDAIWARLEGERETPPPEQQLDLEDIMAAPKAVKPETTEQSGGKIARSDWWND
jgi:phage terminase large subunit GpA-like protein